VTSPPRPDAFSPLELATGVLFGRGAGRRARLAAPPPDETPFEVLQRACLPALRRGPCLVSFSGGRDSSVVLAAAAHAARREALPLPIPVTNRFAGSGQTDESSWQELVVAHLELPDWIRLEHTDELDLVGPVATGVLRRHGLLWPFNAHFHAPMLDAAAGGSLLTGVGGDEVFGSSRWARAVSVLALRESPRPRDAARVALLASPRFVRGRVLARRFPAVFSWLTGEAQTELARGWGADVASEPARLRRRIEWLHGRRWLQAGTRSLGVLADDAGAAIAHPLLDLEFGAAVTACAGRRGFADRGTAMRTLFGNVLPSELLSRTTKACFDSAFWTERSRRWVASWDGEGLDGAVVDHDALRAEWSRPQPDAHTYLLLQALLLEVHGSTEKGHLYDGRVAGGAEAA
jgi:asparagine synthase